MAVGKPQFIKDTSMSTKYEAYGGDDVEGRLGQNGEFSLFLPPLNRLLTSHILALLDLTDFKNDEFVYVY